MREIKFRGKRIDNREWIYGFLLKNGVTYIAYYDSAEQYRPHKELVVPDTVSQYTGLKDKNRIEIYEGDILESKYMRGEVKWLPEHCAFVIRVCNPENHAYDFIESDGKLNDIEVVGNIHDK